MLLALWGIYTFILMIPTLELNFALFSLFFTLSALFFMLAGERRARRVPALRPGVLLLCPPGAPRSLRCTAHSR
jgi:hypothetical protein